MRAGLWDSPLLPPQFPSFRPLYRGGKLESCRGAPEGLFSASQFSGPSYKVEDWEAGLDLLLGATFVSSVQVHTSFPSAPGGEVLLTQSGEGRIDDFLPEFLSQLQSDLTALEWHSLQREERQDGRQGLVDLRWSFS